MAIHIYLPAKKAAKVRDAAPAIGDKVKIHVNGQNLPGTVKAVRGNLISVAYAVISGGEKFNRQDDFHVGKVFNTSGKAFSASAEDAKGKDANVPYSDYATWNAAVKKAGAEVYADGAASGKYVAKKKGEIYGRFDKTANDGWLHSSVSDAGFSNTEYNPREVARLRTEIKEIDAKIKLEKGPINKRDLQQIKVKLENELKKYRTDDSDPSLELAYAVERNPQDVGKRAKKQFSTEAEFLSALLKGGMSKNERCVQEALRAYRTKDAQPDQWQSCRMG